jgi:hypothetical protein
MNAEYQESRRISLVPMAAAGVAAIAILGAAMVSLQSPLIDFFTFWLTARELAEGDIAEPYTRDSWEVLARAAAEMEQSSPRTSKAHVAAWANLEVYGDALEATAAPPLYLAAAPFSRFDYDAAAGAFAVLILAAGGGAVMWQFRLIGWPWWAGWVAAGFFVLLWEPMRGDSRVGNINQLQILGVTAAVALSAFSSRTGWRLAAAGALLGVMTAIKPNVAPIAWCWAGVLAWDRSSSLAARLLAGWFAGGVAVVAASMVWYRDPGVYLLWLRALPIPLTQNTVELGNFCVVALLREIMPAWAAQAVAVTLALALLAAVFLVLASTRRFGPLAVPEAAAREHLLLAGFAGLLVLIPAGLAWLHYFVLVLPLAVGSLPSLGEPMRRARSALVGLGLLLMSSPLVSIGFLPTALAQAWAYTIGLLFLAWAGLLALGSLRGQASGNAGLQETIAAGFPR